MKEKDILLVNVYDYITPPPNAWPAALDQAALRWGRVWTVVGAGSPHGQPNKIRLMLRPAPGVDISEGTQLSTVLYSHTGEKFQKDSWGSPIAVEAIEAGDIGRAGTAAPWFRWVDTSQVDLSNAVDQLVERFNEHVEDYSSLTDEVTELRDTVRGLEKHIDLCCVNRAMRARTSCPVSAP